VYNFAIFAGYQSILDVGEKLAFLIWGYVGYWAIPKTMVWY
jgi:hypothetical protein